MGSAQEMLGAGRRGKHLPQVQTSVPWVVLQRLCCLLPAGLGPSEAAYNMHALGRLELRSGFETPMAGSMLLHLSKASLSLAQNSKVPGRSSSQRRWTVMVWWQQRGLNQGGKLRPCSGSVASWPGDSRHFTSLFRACFFVKWRGEMRFFQCSFNKYYLLSGLCASHCSRNLGYTKWENIYNLWSFDTFIQAMRMLIIPISKFMR